MATIHFLLVYDLNAGHLVHQAEFQDAEKAAAEYAAMETKHRGDKDLEIVLVGADSLEAIQMTHGQYFDKQPDDSESPFLAGV